MKSLQYKLYLPGAGRSEYREATPRSRCGPVSAMNKREISDLRELLERIERLLKEYLMASSPHQLAVSEAEITAAKEKLKRIATSLIN